MLRSYNKNPGELKAKMMEEQASSVIELAKRPEGIPDENTFRFRDIAISEIGERGALLKSLYVSVDPGMRGFMVFDFEDQFEQVKDQLARWYNCGKLKHRQTVAGVFDRVPSTFMVCFKVKILANSWSKYRNPNKFSFFVTICLLNALV